MVAVRKKKESEEVLSRAGSHVELDSIIGVRINKLVRIDEKNFFGATKIFFSKKGGTIEKLLFLFGSQKNVFRKEGMEILCISLSILKRQAGIVDKIIDKTDSSCIIYEDIYV